MVAFFTAAPASAQRMPQDSWYLAKEMKRFVEPGKFWHPHDAALGPDGNLYVADRYNHRVQVFDQDGNFIRQFGNYGSGNGEFNEVTGIHVAPDGKVYVSEWHNARVQVFDALGNFIRSMGQLGSGEGQLNAPHGVTVDDDGNVYVVEHSNARVSVFKPDGTYLRQWGSSGSDDGQFQGAIAICRTPDNKIAVLERDGARRVQIFATGGNLLSKFSGDWVQQGWWDDYRNFMPHGIEADSSGNIYVSGREWKGIQVFNSSGEFLRVISTNGGGSGEGQFNPMGLAVGNGKVFACDWDNHRIAVFSTNGTWSKNFGSHQSAEQDTHGIAVDANGNIFISYYHANVIYKFSPDLAFIKSFGSAGSGDGQFNGVLEMAIGPNQRLYVVDHSGHRVQYFDLEGNFLGKFGSEGAGNGNFKYPWGIAVGKDNKVYVADRDNHRIQVFDANGNYLSKFGTQGSFDGQFQSPHGLAVLPDGKVAVADHGNGRIQIFSGDGNYLSKFNFMDGVAWRDQANPTRLVALSDGLLGISGYFYGEVTSWNDRIHGDVVCVSNPQGERIKVWPAAWCSMAETKSGDLIAAHGDRVVRVWKRTFRTVHPEPSNAIPLPTIVAQKRRPGTSLVDVDYTVKDADNATVQTAALAFKNGGNSLADVIPITSFAEGTANKLGSNIATGQTHKFTWDVARDWSTDFGEVQLEILAKDGRGLLNLDFIRIPAGAGNPELKISRSPVNDNDFLSVWYWLVATGDPDVRLDNGQVLALDGSSEQLDGLVGEYYSEEGFKGNATLKLGEATYYNYYNMYGQTQAKSIRWTGNFVPLETGDHTIRFDGPGNAPNVRIWLNGNELTRIENSEWYHLGARFNFNAQSGTPLSVKIEYDTVPSWSDFNTYIQKPGSNDSNSPSLSYFKSTSTILAMGSTTTKLGRDFIFQRMGLREATAAEVTRAKEAGTPGVINQWEPKLRVGPDERPAKINAYGFDTGADGYWAVPIEGN
jgi:DNA-binding beta-propeller fold protein YncE